MVPPRMNRTCGTRGQQTSSRVSRLAAFGIGAQWTKTALQLHVKKGGYSLSRAFCRTDQSDGRRNALEEGQVAHGVRRQLDTVSESLTHELCPRLIRKRPSLCPMLARSRAPQRRPSEIWDVSVVYPAPSARVPGIVMLQVGQRPATVQTLVQIALGLPGRGV